MRWLLGDTIRSGYYKKLNVLAIKELDKHTAEAMNCFLLISVDYLYRNYHCKRKGVLKYLEFVLHQMHFAQKDEEYFQLMNEELEKEVGVNVLGTLKGE